MISQLASVFSSQGVVLPDTELVGFPARPEDGGPAGAPAAAPADFPVLFEQAAVRLELSARALKAAEEAARSRGGAGRDGKDGEGNAPGAVPGRARGADGRALTAGEAEQVEDLRRRDREVRAHEQAHLAAAGGLAVGGAQYAFQAGPDGRRYAVEGHVDIRLSRDPGNPRATLRNAQAARAAATAPAEPSGADLSVAAAAAQMAAQASRELAGSGAGRAGKAGEDAGKAPGSAGFRNPYAQSRPETGRALDLRA